MPLSPRASKKDAWTADDLPWSEEVKSLGKKPLAVGLILAAMLLIGVSAWALLSSQAGEVFALTSGEAQQEGGAALAQDGHVQGETEAQGAIFVHVIGAVNAPGVYELRISSRVFDAIEAASGFTEDASTETLNLARLVADGEQISVPTLDEAAAIAAGNAGEGGGAAASGASSNMLVNGKVNINAADSSTLQTLSGIGPSTAEKIVSDRETNGPFNAPEDLKRVSGIGDKKYAAIADSICVG